MSEQGQSPTVTELTEEQYFGDMKMLFLQPGWSHLMAYLEQEAERINNLQDIKSMEDLHYVRGQLAAIGTMLNFELITEREEENYYEGIE